MTKTELMLCEELTLSLQHICSKHIAEIMQERVPASTAITAISLMLAVQVVGLEISDDTACKAFRSSLQQMRKHLKEGGGTTWSHEVEPSVPS